MWYLQVRPLPRTWEKRCIHLDCDCVEEMDCWVTRAWQSAVGCAHVLPELDDPPNWVLENKNDA